jgi:hypothetical protein
MERHVAESIRDAKLTGRSIVFAWGKRKGELPFMAQPAGDRKVRMVECADYAAVVSRLDDATDTVAALEAVSADYARPVTANGSAAIAHFRRRRFAIGATARSRPAQDGAAVAPDRADP